MPLVRIDDRDTSRISYTPDWGWYPEFEDGHTLMTSWDYNSKATFRFHGTSITVIGAISNEFPGETYHAEFALDAAEPVTVSRTSTRTSQYDLTLFQASNLRSELHTLVITYKSQGEIDLQIDRIEYWDTQPGSGDDAETATTSSSSSSTGRLEQTDDSPGPGSSTLASQTSTGAHGLESVASSPGTTRTSSSSSSSPSPIPLHELTPTVTLVDITTTDAEGHSLVLTQTQYLRGGETYTTDPGLAASTSSDISSPGGFDDAEGKSTSSGGGTVSLGTMIGAILGALFFAALLLALVLWHRRRLELRRSRSGSSSSSPSHDREYHDFSSMVEGQPSSTSGPLLINSSASLSSPISSTLHSHMGARDHPYFAAAPAANTTSTTMLASPTSLTGPWTAGTTFAKERIGTESLAGLTQCRSTSGVLHGVEGVYGYGNVGSEHSSNVGQRGSGSDAAPPRYSLGQGNTHLQDWKS